MFTAKKFIIFNVLIIFFGVFAYLKFNNKFFIQNVKDNNPSVLAAASIENFGSVSRAAINQYPVIRFNDSFSYPLESVFKDIRPYSNPAKFTNHLCNSVNTTNAGWKADTLTCNYTRNPTFIKLRFPGSSQKLMLNNQYSLFNVDDTNNTATFQSLYIDRFLTNTRDANCPLKVDPDSVYPVYDTLNSRYYLYSSFVGINSTNCLQPYDVITNAQSSNDARGRLFLGFEVRSSGFLNTLYNRVGAGYTSNSGTPYGPGPLNATQYAFPLSTNLNFPIISLAGCAKYDSNLNCTSLSNLNLLNYSHVPIGAMTATCVRKTSRCPNNRSQYDCIENWSGQKSNKDPINNTCGYAYCMPNHTVANFQSCIKISEYDCCTVPSQYDYTWAGGSFTANLTVNTLSTFSNFNKTSVNIVTTAQAKLTSYTTFPVPDAYVKYQNEFSKPNDVNYPINFTSELNKTVFVTDKYLFKLIKSGTTLQISRYTINPNATTYTYGGVSYINQSSKKVINLTIDAGNTKYSLDNFSDDIFVMASGSTTYNFFRITNFNIDTGSNVVDNSPQTELTSKLTTAFTSSYALPSSFGIVNNKIYFVVKDSLFYTTINPAIDSAITPANYKNFEFNGNVFSDQNLTSSIFTAPTKKYIGNYITSNNYASSDSSLKFFNSSMLSFGYFSTFNDTLVNFTNFTGSYSVNKFNYLYGPVNFIENKTTPLNDSQYLTLPTNSTNNYEIIAIGTGKGIKIELTNANLARNYSKYILVNLDKNPVRILFYVNCADLTNYSIICTGTRFNYKSSILGQFFMGGAISTQMENSKFLRIHENADVLVNLMSEIKKKKYPVITSSVITTTYE